MAYIPGRCWADMETWRLACPLAQYTTNGCRGGVECTHRTGQAPQCSRPEQTDIGLCRTCYDETAGEIAA